MLFFLYFFDCIFFSTIILWWIKMSNSSLQHLHTQPHFVRFVINSYLVTLQPSTAIRSWLTCKSCEWTMTCVCVCVCAIINSTSYLYQLRHYAQFPVRRQIAVIHYLSARSSLSNRQAATCLFPEIHLSAMLLSI